MTKNDKNNLDYYFERARAEKPVMGKEDISRLLKRRPVRQPATGAIENILLLFRGLRPMHILSGVSVALAAVLLTVAPFDSDQSMSSKDSDNKATTEQIVRKNVAPQPAQAEESEAVKTDKNNFDTKITLSDHALVYEQHSLKDPENPSSNKDYKPDHKAMTTKSEFVPQAMAYADAEAPARGSALQRDDMRIDIRGINMIELSEEEFKQLGISFDDDGTMHFTESFGGMSLLDVSIKEHTKIDILDGKEPATFLVAPKFVSDKQGNKKLELFNEDDLLNNVMTFNLDRDGNFLFNAEGGFISFKDDSLNKYPTLDSVIKQIIAEGKLQIGQKLEADGIPPNLQFSENCVVSTSIDLKDLNKDGTYNSPFSTSDPVAVPMVIYQKSAKESDTDISSEPFVMNLDSMVLSNSHVSIRFDSTLEHKQIRTITTSSDINDPNLKTKARIISMPASEGTNRSVYAIKDQSIDVDYIRINKLLPFVLKDGNKESPHIVWFDPSRDLLEHLPPSISSKLKDEIEALEGTEDMCGDPIAGKATYSDLWRACNGPLRHLNISPNPTDGHIRLRYELTRNCKTKITLHNLSGETIRELKPMSAESKGEIEGIYLLNDLEPGLYLVSITSAEGHQAVQRVILK